MNEKDESNDGISYALQEARAGDGTAMGDILEGFRSYLT